jgi:glutathione S-transferase
VSFRFGPSATKTPARIGAGRRGVPRLCRQIALGKITGRLHDCACVRDRERGVMTIKLHYHPFSTYSRRVRMACREKQIAYEPVLVDMTARKHREQPYLSLNPYGRVPTLEEDGFVLYESTAILNYLEATHPKPALVPADPRQRALVDMHMKLCDLQFGRPAVTIIFPKRFLPKERWNAAAIAEATKEIEKHLAVLDKQLTGKSFLVAEQFTLAEICYAPFLEFLTLMEISPSPAVAAWSERILSRPSAKETRPER